MAESEFGIRRWAILRRTVHSAGRPWNERQFCSWSPLRLPRPARRPAAWNAPRCSRSRSTTGEFRNCVRPIESAWRVNHRAMMPLASHEPRPQMNGRPRARRRTAHRIQVRGKRDVQPFAQTARTIVTARSPPWFRRAAILRRQRPQPVADIQGNSLFVVGDRFDIDQCRVSANTSSNSPTGEARRRRMHRTQRVFDPIALHRHDTHDTGDSERY